MQSGPDTFNLDGKLGICYHQVLTGKFKELSILTVSGKVLRRWLFLHVLHMKTLGPLISLDQSAISIAAPVGHPCFAAIAFLRYFGFLVGSYDR